MSKPSVQAGKKSIKDVHKELGFVPLKEGDYMAKRNDLDLDPELKAELKELQLVPRWINFKEYKSKGFHRAHWVPYKRQSRPNNSTLFAISPDGYTTREDLVLAVKPDEWNRAHKKYLAQKVQRQSNPQEAHAAALRAHAKDTGYGVVVKEGYED